MAVPAGACDAHIHIFDPRFAPALPGAATFAGATAADYRAVQKRLGTQRAVVVTPRIHVTDNRVTLDAIQQLGIEHTRGVAVLRPGVTDAELQALHAGGIRGIRFTLYTPQQAATTFEMVEPLSRRVSELGWHVQLHWTAGQIVEHRELLARLPSTIVFDHLARLPLPQGTAHPAFGVVRRLLDNGRTWVKLSGPYLDSQAGEAGAYADSDAVARAWVQAAPQRLVWGSDWPHVTETAKPDDAALFALLARWVDDDATRERILVHNPALLYGFGPGAAG
jgi:predicted TIM-barrel fold metal-dependent hydrolase